MVPKSVTFRRHDHLVSVLFGDLLNHSYSITFSMFLDLVGYRIYTLVLAVPAVYQYSMLKHLSHLIFFTNGKGCSSLLFLIIKILFISISIGTIGSGYLARLPDESTTATCALDKGSCGLASNIVLPALNYDVI